MKQFEIWIVVGMLVFAGGQILAQEENNSDYQYALIEAVKQKNLGNLPEAVKLYRLVIREMPECAVAHYELGNIYLMTKQVELAARSLQKAYALEPENKWYTLAYLNALGAGEKLDSMELILKRKVENDPEEVEWEFQLATVYFNMDRTGKALRILKNIEKENGFSEKVTLYKASIYENQKKYEKARKEIEKVMVLFPEVAQFRIAAAELCLKSGMEEEAARYYHDVLEVDSANIYALTNLADYYKDRKEYKDSFRYLEKAFRSYQIDIRRKITTLYSYLSEEFFMTNYKDELERLVDIMVETHPGEMDVRLMASDFYIQVREYEKAYWQLKYYLGYKSGNYPLQMQAVLLANAGSLNEELISMTGELLKTYPDSADIRFFRGIGLYEEGWYRKLIQNFDSIKVDELSTPEYVSQARMLIAESYYRLEEYPVADSIFEMIIKDEPENYTVLNNYSYYLAERGDKLEAAEIWSHKAIMNNPDNATFLDTYAWVLFKMNRFEQAEEYILRAMEKGGENDPEINEHAGDIQAALESFTLARSYYMKAIILGGDRDKLEEKIEAIKRIQSD